MEPLHSRIMSSYAAAYDNFPPPPRRSSTTSTSPPSPQEGRRASLPTHQPTLHSVRTRSVGGFLSAGVIFERDPANPPSDDDIIIVTVRVTKKQQRRDSFDDPLPDRPPPRNFFRRMSTRVLSQPDRDTYKAVKMPRGEYLRHFRHDAQGHYAGTEPEREWAEEEINEKYGQYQEMPLRAVLGRPGAAAGVPMFGW